MTVLQQAAFDVRCEWGEPGVAQLAPISAAVIIVDVLSFSTAVEIATERGAVIFPYRWRAESAEQFAVSLNAQLAHTKFTGPRYSLSPASLLDIPAGTRLVLPSPNGSTLSLGTGQTPTLAGCWRNSRAVARAAQSFGSPVAVIPAGERWPDGRLRPSWEDWMGAGAILRHLPGRRSPEAQAAIDAFEAARHTLSELLRQCGSGQELIERGRERDLVLAAELDVSENTPLLREGAYQKLQAGGLGHV
jgi:2-phosphosulfolactate phosphatase